MAIRFSLMKGQPGLRQSPYSPGASLPCFNRHPPTEAMVSVAPTDAPGLPEAPSRPSPIARASRDGKAGMASQALGLAEPTGFPFIGKRLGIHFPWVCLPPAALVRAVPYGRGYRC